MSFQIGQNVGPYRLIEKLGKGGMATVYKAYHARLDRYVAIKALHPAFMENDGFLDRFQREAKVVARLEHPHIVPIYDFSEHEERPYLVLKYVKGKTLKSYLNERRLTYAEIKEVFLAVSSALVYAHQSGVLHRDIKPSNVLIEEDGGIYLADFGLARIAETSQTTMSAQMMMGTPHYISPEQARGAADLDEGTDIYSLGVMLYELLVGEVPYQADTPFSVIHDHIYSPLPMPREINPALTEAVEKVLLKALAKNRQDRFQDMPHMVRYFTAALELQIKDSGPDQPPPRSAILSQPAHTGSLPGHDSAYQPTLEIDREESGFEDGTQSGVDEEKDRSFSIPGMVWWFILPALLLLILGTTVVSRAAQPPGPELITAPTLTQEANLAPSDFSGPSSQSAEPVREENSEDPFLWVERGVDLWEQGRMEDAEEAFREAIALAERNPEAYLTIGDLLSKRGLWVYAGMSYLQLEKHDTGIPKEEIKTRIRQAVYLAAFQEGSLAVFSRPSVDLDEALLRLVEARRLIIDGKMERAKVLIERTYQARPELHESRLLTADLLLEVERTMEARIALEELLALEGLSEWIRIEAEQTLQSLDS